MGDELAKQLAAINLLGSTESASARRKPTDATTSKALLPPNEEFVDAINGSSFVIFEPVADLGFYSWTPKGDYKDLSSVTKLDITRSITVDHKPPTVQPIAAIRRQCPLQFENLPPQTHRNEFPYNQSYAPTLYVASVERGVDLTSIDFVMGGSTLGFLANRGSSLQSAKYMACVVPGTKAVLIANYGSYMQDYSQPGYQFERLVTGQPMSARHDETMVEHMQLMKVRRRGGKKYVVLFGAQCDAVDDRGNPVEVTSSNPRNWGNKKLFQMMSSGSLTLYSGSKSRGTMLSSVQVWSLSQMERDALRYHDVEELEENIVSCMDKVRDSLVGLLKDGEVMELSFSPELQLRKSNLVVLPSTRVMKELLALN